MPFNTTLKNETGTFIQQNARQQWKRMSERKHNDWWVIQAETLTKQGPPQEQYTAHFRRCSKAFWSDYSQTINKPNIWCRECIGKPEDWWNYVAWLTSAQSPSPDESRCRSSLKTETGQSMSTCGCHHAAELTSESEQAKVSDLVWAPNS